MRLKNLLSLNITTKIDNAKIGRYLHRVLLQREGNLLHFELAVGHLSRIHPPLQALMIRIKINQPSLQYALNVRISSSNLLETIS